MFCTAIKDVHLCDLFRNKTPPPVSCRLARSVLLRRHFPQYTSFIDNAHSYHWNSMNSYVFLTHCDLWQASQHCFLLFLLLSVHTPYHQVYVCGCKKTFLTYSMASCNRPRMAGWSNPLTVIVLHRTIIECDFFVVSVVLSLSYGIHLALTIRCIIIYNYVYPCILHNTFLIIITTGLRRIVCCLKLDILYFGLIECSILKAKLQPL